MPPALTHPIDPGSRIQYKQFMTTLDLIAKKLALAEAATPDWTQEQGFPEIVSGLRSVCEGCSGDTEFVHECDAAFIADARTGYPAALAALRVAVSALQYVKDHSWAVSSNEPPKWINEFTLVSEEALASIDKILEGAK